MKTLQRRSDTIAIYSSAINGNTTKTIALTLTQNLENLNCNPMFTWMVTCHGRKIVCEHYF